MEGAQSKEKSNLKHQQEGYHRSGPKRKLKLIDEFFMVMVRCKVGLFEDDLADRFDIAVSQVSKIFTTHINLVRRALQQLFPMPTQAEVRFNMPKEFEEYPTTRMIIDCTELFIEIPSSLVAQSQIWSQYKHHNTFKVLVGITPMGQVCFVSKLWTGRATDREITIKSGVLEHLEFGDNLMADRGFDIADIMPAGTTLNIPPFKGTRAQLSALETEETKKIASVRIHVERAIQRIKNYHILDGIMPLKLHPLADEIFQTCALLTNFLPPLVTPGRMSTPSDDS